MQTSLFSIDKISKEIKESVNTTKSKSKKTCEKTKAVIGKATKKVNDVIGNIKMGETIHYASMGEWSTHDLLFHILKQTGPANVYISTWSVSENAVRQIIKKIKDNVIIKLICLFDWRVKIRRPEAFEFMKYNISDIRLSSSHAKVTVVENDKWSIAIVGSANYTNNPRIEAGVISCDKKAADFHKGWILEELKNSDPFDTKKKKR